MNIDFKTELLKDLFLGKAKGKQKFSQEVLTQYKKKVKILRRIKSTTELYKFKGLHFEKFKHGRFKGKHSIRLNDQFRLIFERIKEIQNKKVIELLLINEISKHYE